MEINTIAELPTDAFCVADNQLIKFDRSPIQIGKISHSGFSVKNQLHAFQLPCEQIYPVWIDEELVLVCSIAGCKTVVESISGKSHEFDQFSVWGVWRNQFLITNVGTCLTLYLDSDTWKYKTLEVFPSHEEFEDLAVLSNDNIATYYEEEVQIWRWNPLSQRFFSSDSFPLSGVFCSGLKFGGFFYVLMQSNEDPEKCLYRITDNDFGMNQCLAVDEGESLRSMTVWRNFLCTLHQQPGCGDFTLKLWDSDGLICYEWTSYHDSPADYGKIQSVEDFLLISSPFPANGVTYVVVSMCTDISSLMLAVTLAWSIQKVLWAGWLMNPGIPFSTLPKDVLKEIINILREDALRSGTFTISPLAQSEHHNTKKARTK